MINRSVSRPISRSGGQRTTNVTISNNKPATNVNNNSKFGNNINNNSGAIKNRNQPSAVIAVPLENMQIIGPNQDVRFRNLNDNKYQVTVPNTISKPITRSNDVREQQVQQKASHEINRSQQKETVNQQNAMKKISPVKVESQPKVVERQPEIPPLFPNIHEYSKISKPTESVRPHISLSIQNRLKVHIVDQNQNNKITNNIPSPQTLNVTTPIFETNDESSLNYAKKSLSDRLKVLQNVSTSKLKSESSPPPAQTAPILDVFDQ